MAERAIFKGAILLGSFPIPIQVVKATKDHDVAFHEYHSTDLARTGRKSICKGCGKDLESAEIIKGVEVSKGNIVCFSKEEMESLPLKSTREIAIERYVGIGELNPLMFESAYYVTPSEDYAVKAFTQFVKGLQKLHKIAIGKVAMRSREQLCALQPLNGGLVMNTMYYQDEIRGMPQTKTAEVNDGEVELISQVISKFSKPFEHGVYTDDYTDAVNTMVDAKMKGQPLPVMQMAANKEAPALEDALKDLLSK